MKTLNDQLPLESLFIKVVLKHCLNKDYLTFVQIVRISNPISESVVQYVSDGSRY